MNNIQGVLKVFVFKLILESLSVYMVYSMLNHCQAFLLKKLKKLEHCYNCRRCIQLYIVVQPDGVAFSCLCTPCVCVCIPVNEMCTIVSEQSEVEPPENWELHHQCV